MIYNLGFAGKNYQIKCEPLSRLFLKRIFAMRGETPKDSDVLFAETVKESRAQWREIIDGRVVSEDDWRSDGFETMPQKVLDVWFTEMISSSQAQVTISLEQEKN